MTHEIGIVAGAVDCAGYRAEVECKVEPDVRTKNRYKFDLAMVHLHP